MASPPISELHNRLRQATKAHHHDLDHHPLLTPLIKPDLGITAYGNALSALHGVYAVAEDWILDYLGRHPGMFDYTSRRKLPALTSDLATLGRTPIPTRIDFVAEPRIGALVGILYTIEGSTQGGQFIAQNLRKIDAVRWPMRFFAGYGDLSRQRWDEFLRFAEVDCPREDYELAASTAVSLFRAIKHHLDNAQASLSK
jgi:heme oxygenase